MPGVLTASTPAAVVDAVDVDAVVDAGAVPVELVVVVLVDDPGAVAVVLDVLDVLGVLDVVLVELLVDVLVEGVVDVVVEVVLDVLVEVVDEVLVDVVGDVLVELVDDVVVVVAAEHSNESLLVVVPSNVPLTVVTCTRQALKSSPAASGSAASFPESPETVPSLKLAGTPEIV